MEKHVFKRRFITHAKKFIPSTDFAVHQIFLIQLACQRVTEWLIQSSILSVCMSVYLFSFCHYYVCLSFFVFVFVFRSFFCWNIFLFSVGLLGILYLPLFLSLVFVFLCFCVPFFTFLFPINNVLIYVFLKSLSQRVLFWNIFP